MSSSLRITFFLLFFLFFRATQASALENIIRPFQSARSDGMGGVKLTTGFFEENFYGNPARNTANPNKRVQLLDIQAETSTTTLDTIGDLTGSGDTLTKIAATSGKSSHGRLQTTFPGFYWVAGGKWYYAAAFLMSTQFDIALRNSYRIEPVTIIDAGPQISAARKYLDDALSVGFTTHFAYRLSTRQGYTFTDLIKGVAVSPAHSGGEGGMIDLSLGSTYDLPSDYCEIAGWNFQAGAAVNDLFDGKYQSIKVKVISTPTKPIQQPRSFGFGMAARKPALGIFTQNVIALEFSDIGNNPSGSLFRTVHIGAETHWWKLIPRAGIYQGYWTIGTGFKWHALELEAASYAEEMTLNVGGREDRRYVVRLSIAI